MKYKNTDNFYRDNILDHYKNPRNYGRISSPDRTIEEENVSCGDRIGIDIRFDKGKEGKNRISGIKFHGEGCAISIAAASMLTEKVSGMTFADIRQLSRDDIVSLLKIELSPGRLKCALLPLEALQKIVS